MHPFSYARAKDEDSAVHQVSSSAASQYIAGGTTLLDLIKLDVMQPAALIDINKLSFAEVKQTGDGAVIGALAKNTDVAMNPYIREQYPILSQALLSGASVQLRNMATVGGNVLQRCRCPYFRDTTLPCNKREPGTGCPAIEGYSRMHAIFGGSDDCIAVHPSDMVVAMVALDATVLTKSDKGERRILLNDFYVLPEDRPERETVLKPGELIVAVELPQSKFANNSYYLKVRDRTSFSFALVSVAALLHIEGGTIQDARIVLGGVGTRAWRVKAGEKQLIGKAPSKEVFAGAAAASIADAKPTKHNKFKVKLTERSIVRALEIAAGGIT